MSQIAAQTKRQVALTLHQCGILKFGKFVLKGGVETPFYIDMRILQSFPEAFHKITAVYAELIKDLPKDVLLAGIPEAGTPLATAVGYQTMRPLIQPRAKVKEHGTKRVIEGNWQPGDKVAIIDDLVTIGDSKLEAVERLEQNGLKVIGFYLLLDREMGGKQIVEKKGYILEAAMTITEALTILRDEKKLSPAKYQQMIDFTRRY